MKIVLATHNQGKLREFEHLLQLPDLQFLPQSEYGIADIEETGLSFVENALLKARHAALNSGLPALADDSGLCVPILGGEPGIYSARYAGEMREPTANIQKLLQKMEGIQRSDRKAYFVCCLVYMTSHTDETPIICQAKWHGEILMAPKGKQGFGYDPIFYVPEYDCSAGELATELKHQMSHRAKALQLLKEAFQCF